MVFDDSGLRKTLNSTLVNLFLLSFGVIQIVQLSGGD